MKKKISPQLSVRLYTDAKCFGPGIAELLQRVQKLSSLRSAAISMNMAYSKAWSIIKNCESALGFKLLKTTTGGRHGGGAVLTDEAEKILEAYTEFCREVNEYANSIFADRFSLFDDSSNEMPEDEQ